MELRAYSVCAQCAAVTPTGRGCPSCDADTVAGQQIARARAVAAELPPLVPTPLSAPFSARPAFAALSMVVLAGAVVASLI